LILVDMSGETRIIKLPIRQTGMGASTRNLVFIRRAGKWERLRPLRVELSKTGRHGEEVYELPSNDYIIVTLNVSSTGKRGFEVSARGEGEVYAPRLLPLLRRWEAGGRVKIEELEHILQ
jgi:hypothetical protein